MAMSEGMGVTPVYNLDRGNDGGMFGGDGGGMWVFFLFFLLAWGGNGGGLFGGRGEGAATNMINNDFLYTNLNQSLGRLADSTAQGFTGIQNGICNLGYTNLSNFKDMQAQMASCLVA